MKKGAIFDHDGLMYDTIPIFNQAWKQAAEELGLVYPDGFRRAVSGSGGDSMRRIIHSWIPEADPDELMRRVYAISYEIQSRHLPEKPGLHEILTWLHDHGVRIAAASSSNRGPVTRNLERSGILPLFDAVLCVEDYRVPKPDPDPFQSAARMLGLDPSDCYVFEDSFNGVRAGHSAGCCTIMIPDVWQPDEEISRLYDACFPSLLVALEHIQAGDL